MAGRMLVEAQGPADRTEDLRGRGDPALLEPGVPGGPDPAQRGDLLPAQSRRPPPSGDGKPEVDRLQRAAVGAESGTERPTPRGIRHSNTSGHPVTTGDTIKALWISTGPLHRLAIMLRTGVLIQPSYGTGNDVDDLVRQTAEAARAGVSTVWSGQGFGYDMLTALAAVGREVPGIELGAAVVPVQLRHPMVLAAQAQTVQAASGGRLVLGLGVSHPVLMEQYGVRTEKPVRTMREHLATLAPILRGGRTSGDVAGADGASAGLDEMLSSTAVRGAKPEVPILLGAMGPAMLRVAGELADGTVTFLVGRRTLGEHVVPTITAAAEAAGRAAPRVVVCLPIAITNDVDRLRADVARNWAVMAAMPSYRAMLDREGVADAGQVAVAGDEGVVLAELERLTALGATDFYAVLVGTAEEQRRTLGVLGGLARDR